MKDAYVTSVAELLVSGMDTEDVLKNLKSVLKKRGHGKLFPPILRGVATQLEVNQSKLLPTVYVRKQADAEVNKKHIEQALAKLHAEEKPKIVTDETLVGGFVAKFDHKQIDQSYKNKLISLYQKVTH